MRGRTAIKRKCCVVKLSSLPKETQLRLKSGKVKITFFMLPIHLCLSVANQSVPTETDERGTNTSGNATLMLSVVLIHGDLELTRHAWKSFSFLLSNKKVFNSLIFEQHTTWNRDLNYPLRIYKHVKKCIFLSYGHFHSLMLLHNRYASYKCSGTSESISPVQSIEETSGLSISIPHSPFQSPLEDDHPVKLPQDYLHSMLSPSTLPSPAHLADRDPQKPFQGPAQLPMADQNTLKPSQDQMSSPATPCATAQFPIPVQQIPKRRYHTRSRAEVPTFAKRLCKGT